MFFSLRLMIIKLFIRKAYMYIVPVMQITIVFLMSHLELIILINGFTKYMFMEALRLTVYLRFGFIQFCLEK